MTHGMAACRPDANRISECVCLRLMKQYKIHRNRPSDIKGKKLPITQSIVKTYSNLQQLIQDCREVQENTDLVLVTINNTTVYSWSAKHD